MRFFYWIIFIFIKPIKKIFIMKKLTRHSLKSISGGDKPKICGSEILPPGTDFDSPISCRCANQAYCESMSACIAVGPGGIPDFCKEKL